MLYYAGFHPVETVLSAGQGDVRSALAAARCDDFHTGNITISDPGPVHSLSDHASISIAV